MRLDRNMSNIMIRLSPGYSRFTDHKGCVVVRLDKALYGCVESAALWYENLRVSLSELGYIPNAHDMCMFNKHDEYGVQCTIAVHVDDLMVTSTNGAMIESVASGLMRRCCTCFDDRVRGGHAQGKRDEGGCEDFGDRGTVRSERGCRNGDRGAAYQVPSSRGENAVSCEACETGLSDGGGIFGDSGDSVHIG